jgi:queuosine precursor transporter
MSKHYKLTLLTAIFVAGLLSANLLGSKVTTLFGISMSVGIFAYPLTFLMTDAIAEVYGKKKAMQIVYAALIAQVLVLFLTWISVILPPASRYAFNAEYTTVFGGSIRMIIASLIAFVVAQTHDVWAFEFWRKKFNGKYLWLRNNASTFVSQAIDTLLFMFIAFYGINEKFTVGFILELSLTYWGLKILFAALDTPFVYALVKWLKTGSDTNDPIPVERQ